MFAVPGWNVSAKSLKTQTNNAPPQGAKERSSAKTEPPTKHSRKRKRTDREKDRNGFQDDQVASLWGQYADGTMAGGDKAPKAKKNKNRKGRHAASSTDWDEWVHKPAGRSADTLLESQLSTTKPFTAEGSVSKETKKQKNDFEQPEGSVNTTSNDSRGHANIPHSYHDDKNSSTARIPGPKGTKWKEDRKTKRQQEAEENGHLTQSQDSTKKRERKAPYESKKPAQKEISSPKPEKYAVDEDPKGATSKANPPQTSNASLQFLKQPISKPQNSLPSSLTPLQQKMRAKLTSARFRHLNETLYTTPSTNARDIFNNNPELFTEYHAGFSQQVMEWPENPVNGYVAKIKSASSTPSRGKPSRAQPGELPILPRSKGTCTIVDLGCGDAFLARSVAHLEKTHHMHVLSYDFRKSNELVTVADITTLPLEDRVADVAIFCLSLMGTNWIECIEEAWRVLRFGGECWVSEVKSRFGRVNIAKGKKIGETKSVKNGGGKKKSAAEEEAEDDNSDTEIFAENQDKIARDETDVSAFVEVVQRRGFTLRPGSVDKSNKMFVRMEFVKSSSAIRGKWGVGDMGRSKDAGGTWHMKRPKGKFIDEEGVDAWVETKVLKPCVYKIR